jgi:hypothetical protein
MRLSAAAFSSSNITRARCQQAVANCSFVGKSAGSSGWPYLIQTRVVSCSRIFSEPKMAIGTTAMFSC